MKSMASAILFSSIILAAQVASADSLGFPSAADDAGVTLAPRVTYADQHASDRLENVQSAFASNAPDGVFLPANVTHASEYASDPMVAGSAFPEAVDDAGVHLMARTTYADTHLARSQTYRSEQGTDADAN